MLVHPIYLLHVHMESTHLVAANCSLQCLGWNLPGRVGVCSRIDRLSVCLANEAIGSNGPINGKVVLSNFNGLLVNFVCCKAFTMETILSFEFAGRPPVHSRPSLDTIHD